MQTCRSKIENDQNSHTNRSPSFQCDYPIKIFLFGSNLIHSRKQLSNAQLRQFIWPWGNNLICFFQKTLLLEKRQCHHGTNGDWFIGAPVSIQYEGMNLRHKATWTINYVFLRAPFGPWQAATNRSRWHWIFSDWAAFFDIILLPKWHYIATDPVEQTL